MQPRDAFAGPVRHVYVHVPFCAARCDYCDFYSEVVPLRRAEGGAPEPAKPAASAPLDRFVDAVSTEWELERAAHEVHGVRTLYFGGGTPALLGVGRLERLYQAFAAQLTAHAEVTVETNPDEADEAFAVWAARRDVRISLGVQSFLPRMRAALGRRPAADPSAAVRRLRAAGVRDISVDLIHGIPGQTADDVDHDLVVLADLAPDHVSWYELDVVPGTSLARRHPQVPSDDERAALYRQVVRGLERLGYRWYEVSNFARPGRRARHNVAYWRARPYLGLGPGAVSTVGGRRWRDAADVAGYVAALDPSPRDLPSPQDLSSPRDPSSPREPSPPPREVESLGRETLARERLMLAARCGSAVPLADVRPVLDPGAVAPLVAAGLLSLHSGRIRVTRKGRYVGDEVCVRLFRA